MIHSGKFFGMAQTSFSLKKLVLIFFLINLGLKLFHIQYNPSALTYDEVIYTAEAQSIVKYGTDLKGGWKPWHLEPSDSYYTELTSTVLTPGFLIFPNNPILASKFVPVLLGSLIPIFLGLLAYRLRKNKNVFIVTTLFATLNPWVFQFSRMGYDSLFSIGFYLFGMVVLLYAKEWRKLWAVIPLFLGFFQYQGHKPLLVPLIFICVVFLFFEKYSVASVFKQFKKVITDKSIVAAKIVFIFSLVLTVSYLIRLPHLTSSERASEFSVYDEVQLSSSVNEARRMSLNSPVTSLFINKYTLLLTQLTDRFLNSFDLKRLFIEGDRRVDTFSVLDYGYFHLADIFIIVIALAFVIYNKKDFKTLAFVLSFILIGTLPNVIRTGEPWILLRGAFLFLGIILLSGIGIASFLDQLQKKYVLAFFAIYILATTPFFFAYFYRYPISHTKNIGFYERVLASYVSRSTTSDEEVFIVPDRDDATFVYLIHYNALLTEENKDQVSESMHSRKYAINSIHVEGGCTEEVKTSENKKVVVYSMKEPCQPAVNSSAKVEIKSLIDSGTIFTIYNDTLCQDYNLGSYSHVKKNVFNIENLSNQEFCESFFSK